MSIKRFGFFAALLVLVFSAGTHAQTIDLTDLKTDFNTVFTSLGHDIAPRLHQISLSGNDMVGEARLHGTKGFYVGFGSSLTMIDGVANILASEDPADWEYDTLPISTLVKDAVEGDSSAEDALEMFTEKALPMPSMRMVFGFPLPRGYEFLGHGFYLPGAVLDAVKNAAGDSVDFNQLDPQAEILTIGGVLRKTILSDKKAFWRPAVSLGVGYTYSHFLMAFDGFSFDALDIDPPDVGMGALDMAGDMGFETTVHSIGAVLGVSKTILKVFTPYAKAAAYYHSATYKSHFNVTATIYKTDTNGNIIEPRDKVEEIDIKAPVSVKTADVSILLSTGMEVRLLPVTLLFGVTVDLERPVAEIDSLSMNGFKMNGVGVTTSLRVQI